MDEFEEKPEVHVSRYAKVPNGMGAEEGCIFLIHNVDIMCPQKDHFTKCHKCGWNPRVEDIRKHNIRERMKLDVR